MHTNTIRQVQMQMQLNSMIIHEDNLEIDDIPDEESSCNTLHSQEEETIASNLCFSAKVQAKASTKEELWAYFTQQKKDQR